MPEKRKGLLIDAALYLVAFAIAWIPFTLIENIIAAAAAFTVCATFLLFLASCAFSDVSIYDPYWSVAPVVMLLAIMYKCRLWNANALTLLALFLVWSVRLTGNWYITYRGLRHEDWRYAMYRETHSAPVFTLISFFGLHLVPTLVVFSGFIPAILSIQEARLVPLSLVGALVMLAAVWLEYVSDRSLRRFLREHPGQRRTCNEGVWKYSRHPNYLGEMSFWTGLFLYYAALRPEKWYLGIGFLTIILLFLAVSVPMMEKHNASRRPDYAEYREKTSMLLLLPNRH